MPIEIRMPALSPTMTEGNLARWLKKEGDEVHAGDVIAEIETDKATMEYEAVDEGRIGKIIVPEGAQGIKVNQPIAVLLEEGEDTGALAGFTPAAVPNSSPRPAGGEREFEAKPMAGEGPPASAEPKTEPAPAPPAPSAPQAPVRGNGAEHRVFASPLARRMAQHAGLDLAAIRGSGPQGRIVKSDIEAALTGSARAAPGASPAFGGAPAAGPALSKDQVVALAGNIPYTERPHSGMRRTIARRLAEAKRTIPHFYETIDCEIDELLRVRKRLNARPDAAKISVNDFVVRAVASALKKVPAANASWSDDAILLWDRVDVAVAVALDDGLITPIVKEADRKGLAQIAAETKDLAERARAGKLKLEEFQGGTFSISNLGMYGVREFAAVINPPQGCILAVGEGAQRPVVRDGQLAVATVMTCTLSCDHRVVDGAVGAQFLAAFKTFVEDPAMMLL
jgi:pyruvate dehydrogenase E2 component (dihydrolipoamide acetyltransferase)